MECQGVLSKRDYYRQVATVWLAQAWLQCVPDDAVGRFDIHRRTRVGQTPVSGTCVHAAALPRIPFCMVRMRGT